ncbi:peptide chain release factor N(5)-glutamine methyltransferase [Liberiplasma polymorphum]|uniref:peptide chain release factor N(5)-glutamine methyltransferase n=1 Tax=Liberiplasma polymorphum TaxID=3374570 RepID=UPI003774E290
MPTFQQALKINEQYAIDNNKEPSAIKLLMLHFSCLNSANLVAKLNDEMDEGTYKKFLRAVDEYIINNKPVQYITENEFFYGYKFNVNNCVLIPRFETEELVTNVLELKNEYFQERKVKLVDIGTGSGCLAIALALEDQTIEAHGTDISEEALAVAKENNDTLHANVTFYHGDMLEPVNNQKFDILVSNPPYIPNGEHVAPLVKDYEPHIALFGGEDGLDYYRKIIIGAESILNDRYIIAFEHAFDKSKEIKRLIKKYLKNIRIIQKKDMQGKDRMTFVLKKD